MLRSFLTSSLLLLNFISYTQTKEVEINPWLRHTVPEGKVLELTNAKFYKLILSDDVFKSGTGCNAMTYANPKYIYGISYYENTENERGRPKTIGFTFKEIKHDYDDVYQIKPYFILRENMGVDDIIKSLHWKFQTQKIIFYPGTTVFPSTCIRSMLLTERSMTAQEKTFYNKKEVERLELKRMEEQRQADEKAQKKLRAQEIISDKFNNNNSIYDIEEIYNVKQIALSDSVIKPLLNALALKSENSIKDEFLKTERKMFYNNSISVIALWDASGSIVSLRTEKFKSISAKVPSLDLLEKDTNTVKVKEYLTLKEAPLTKLEDKIRPCYFKNPLFVLDYFVSGHQQFDVKKKHNKIVYRQGKDSPLKKEFEETASVEMENLPDGNHSFDFYTIDYKFKLLSGLFSNESTITVRKGIVSPNRVKYTVY